MEDNGAKDTASDLIPGYADMLSKLADQMKNISLPAIFASTILGPKKGAWAFTVDKQDYCVAHPEVWHQFPEATTVAPNVFVLNQAPVINIDDPREHRMRSVVFEALARAALQPTTPGDHHG